MIAQATEDFANGCFDKKSPLRQFETKLQANHRSTRALGYGSVVSVNWNFKAALQELMDTSSMSEAKVQGM